MKKFEELFRLKKATYEKERGLKCFGSKKPKKEQKHQDI